MDLGMCDECTQAAIISVLGEKSCADHMSTEMGHVVAWVRRVMHDESLVMAIDEPVSHL